jgi:hypothetical protein
MLVIAAQDEKTKTNINMRNNKAKTLKKSGVFRENKFRTICSHEPNEREVPINNEVKN